MNHSVLDKLKNFYDRYCEDEIGTLLDKYPSEQKSLYIDFADLYQFDADLADDMVDRWDESFDGGTMQDHAERALRDYNRSPVEIPDVHVRLTDTQGYLPRLKVSDALASEHIGEYVALRCQIGDVTGQMSRITEAGFECQKCGGMNYIPQGFVQFQEPHECQACTRDGPYHINYEETEFVDQRKIRFEQPPEEQANGSGDEIVGYCLDDLVHAGDGSLTDKAGSRVTVLGTMKVDDSDLYGRGDSEPVVDKYFIPEAFIFDEQDETIDVDAHREQVNEWASRDDAVDVFKRSIDPGLTITGKWAEATEMATAWLFGAPRIDPDDGDMVRGDIHMLFVSDPGMRKSVFAENLEELSPQCLLRDAGGMSSEVGLTSSASQDAFGDGKWTLTPGALPRANGGHLILDEIDKGPNDFLGGIHGALEGDQQLKVNKADISATLATRVGFLALGNPVDGRFDPYEDIASQIDLDPALMSRFDLIVTMEDTPDEETDESIAEGVLESIDESARMEYGELNVEDAESVAPEVPRKVMQAWVKIAREEIHPLMTTEAKHILQEFYVDARQLNDDESDKPPFTARKLVAGWRLASAFARCELSERIEPRHAERAVNLSKSVIGENFDPETGEFDPDRTTEGKTTQQQRVQTILEVCRGQQLTVDEIVDETGFDRDQVENRVHKLYQKGELIRPIGGTNPEYRAT